jgi:hypothetical protein
MNPQQGHDDRVTQMMTLVDDVHRMIDGVQFDGCRMIEADFQREGIQMVTGFNDRRVSTTTVRRSRRIA